MSAEPRQGSRSVLTIHLMNDTHNILIFFSIEGSLKDLCLVEGSLLYSIVLVSAIRQHG